MKAIRATPKAWRGIVLILVLAVGPAAGAPLRCQIVPAADAHLRLAVWGRELAGAKRPVTAHSARQVAWVADRYGTVLDALFLVTLDRARGPNPPAGTNPRRPRWVRCEGGFGGERKGDQTLDR